MRKCTSKYHQSERLVDDSQFKSLTRNRCNACEAATRAAYRDSNQGKDTLNNWYTLNRDKILLQTKEYQNSIKSTKGYIFSNAKRRARKENITFTITVDDIIIPEICPVLNIPLEVAEGGRTWRTPSLDRINNLHGYIPGNVAVISWRANYMKRDLLLDEVVLLYRYMLCNDMQLNTILKDL